MSETASAIRRGRGHVRGGDGSLPVASAERRARLAEGMLIALAVLSAFVGGGWADEPDTAFSSDCERFFPADTQMFIGVRDLAGAAQAFKKTGTYRMYAEPSLQMFLAKGIKGMSFVATEAVLAARETIGGIALGVLDFRLESGVPSAQMLIVLELTDANEDIDKLIRALLKHFEATGATRKATACGHEYLTSSPGGAGGEQFAVLQPDPSRARRFLLFGAGGNPVPAAIARFAGDPAATLAHSPTFRDAAARTAVAAPEYIVYVDWERTWPALRSAIIQYFQFFRFAPDTVAFVVAILDKLGLDNVQQIVATGGFRDEGAEDAAFIGVGDNRRGLFAVVGESQVPSDLLDLVPHDVAGFSAGAIDYAALYEVLVDALGDIAIKDGKAEEKVKIRAYMDDLQAKCGLEFADELRRCLGDFTISYAFLPQSGGLLTGLATTTDSALLIQVTDAERLRALLGAVLEQLPEGSVRATEIPYKSYVITEVPIPISVSGPVPMPLALAVAYCVTDDWLVVSTQALSVKNALSRLENPGASIVTRDEFKRAAARLPKDHAWVEYSDLASNFRYLYGLLVPMLYLSGGAITGAGRMPVDFSVLPNVDEVARHLFPSMSTVTVLEEGLSSRSYGPVGGATLLAAGVGFGLPALLARGFGEQPTRDATQCAENLKHIYTACMLYSSEHDDRFPPSIEAIAADLDPEMLQCPAEGDSDSAPDYALVPGLVWTSNAELMLAYEKAAHHGGRRHVLLVSGEVKPVAEEEFLELLHKGRSEPEEE